ncbi:MAG: hypothetical protein H6Q05_4042 [Acidobacteria bacterium]|nr:hypothetical protein [Acidobacteriota bacterium]
MRRTHLYVVGCLFVLTVLSSQVLWGQATTSLRGTVTDPTGAVVPGATVAIKSAETDLTRTTQTGMAGTYEFLQIPPGTYTLTVTATGFAGHERTALRLEVATPATVNVSLSLGQPSEVISVQSDAAPLNVSDASLGVAFNESQVKQLPLEGRNVPDLLTLQAGVVYTGNRSDIDRDTDTRSGAVNGARSDQSNITLDGVDVNDQGNGYAFTSVLPVTLDSVQEFRVSTTNYNADQGRSSGAQVALVTKSGTNDFHGSVYEYNRNTATSANDYFVKNSQLASGMPNSPPKLIRNIYGFSLGGPLVKDKLFFFANWEGTKQREETSAVRTVPTDSLKQGILKYPDVDGNVVTLTPDDLRALDPLGLGPNPVVMDYFRGYPSPNDNSVGDGLNFSGYRFKGPIKVDKNFYIARVDYHVSTDHTLFWRGALQNVSNAGDPFLPGQVPMNTNVDYSKGFALGYTAVLSRSVVNNFRWGFTRQSTGNVGNSDQTWVYFRILDQGITRTHDFQMPIHNFVDDLSWSKGSHSLQFGANIATLRNPRRSYLGSFSEAYTNASWLDTAGFAGTGNPFDPPSGGYPEVDPAFSNSYDFPLIALLGMVTEVDAYYNYDKQGNLLAQGDPVQRRFGFSSYEFYAQDAWRIRPNLTVTYGLRYSLYSPPWETNGLQVAPSINMNELFETRQANMLKGIPSNQDPLITFDLSGPANGKPGYYPWNRNNFAPRIAVAWTPHAAGNGWWKKLIGGNDKTVVRAGFGMVYDRVGMGLLNTFDSNGSFGLATTLTNPAAVQTASSAPRLTSMNVIPETDNDGNQIYLPAPPGAFPQTPPYSNDTGGFAIAWGLDDKIKTPRSYQINFSIGRELPWNTSLELAYVGRISRKLMTQRDLMMPLDLVDPKSNVHYFAAAKRFSELARANTPVDQVNAQVVGSTAAYWQNLLQPLQPGGAYSLFCNGGSTEDPVQAMYDMFSCFLYNETTAQAIWDNYGGIADANLADVYYSPVGGQNSYYNRQYSSLYAWSSIGNASYHAFQATFRKHLARGLQFDINYAFSKSLDLSSDAERVGAWGGLGGQVINSWSPYQLKAISDFDTPHQFNANFIYVLPFGRDMKHGTKMSRGLDALLGGWQVSGLVRLTSGFPGTVYNGYRWPTNWQLGGDANVVGSIPAGTVKRGDGTVSMFTDTDKAIAAFDAPYPGDAGARNVFRGDGYATWDMSLSKRWKMPWREAQSLQFRWEVFNLPNLTRFDVQSNTPELDQVTAFGNYTGLLTQPRVMQFALRYEF